MKGHKCEGGRGERVGCRTIGANDNNTCAERRASC